MKRFLLILVLVLFAKLGNATETVMGSETVMGTQTKGTITVPYITQAILTPQEVTITAGQSVTYITEVIWNDGLRRKTNKIYTSDSGNLFGNIFTGTQAGTSIITVAVDGQQATARVIILPAQLEKVKMIINEPTVIYGRLYNKSLFSFIGYDVYGNTIKLDKIEFKMKRKGASHLSTWIGEADIPTTATTRLEILKNIIRSGVIFNNEILFFDVGEYEVLVLINDTLQTTFIVNVIFDNYPNEMRWANYRITKKINFEKGTFEVEYAFPGEPAILVQFNVPEDWQKQFREGSMVQKFQVFCRCHYRILQKGIELLKDFEWQLLQDAFLNPLTEGLK